MEAGNISSAPFKKNDPDREYQLQMAREDGEGGANQMRQFSEERDVYVQQDTDGKIRKEEHMDITKEDTNK